MSTASMIGVDLVMTSNLRINFSSRLTKMVGKVAHHFSIDKELMRFTIHSFDLLKFSGCRMTS